ncbi:MAG: DUF167 domain-containing protein [Acidimicrobiia bacterium]
MSDVSDLFSVHDGYVVVDVHVQPRAGRTAVVGRHGAALKLRVAAPPADGRANDATCALLARTLGVKDSAVSLVSGASSRTKRVRIDGADGPTTAAALRGAIAAGSARPGNPERGLRR